MKVRAITLTAVLLLTLSSWTCLTVCGSAETESAQCSSSAQQALKRSQLDVARQGFKTSFDEAQRVGDKASVGVCAFYLGLVAQREAQEAVSSKTQGEQLAQAINWYALAIDWNPRAAGIVSNLARAYVGAGRSQEADTLYQGAIGHAKVDERAPLLQGYADLLASQGRWLEAAKYYRSTLNLAGPEQPVNYQAWSALLDIVLEHLPAQLEPEVWRAIEEGHQTASAQARAFKALTGSVKLPAKTRISLLKAIVSALAQQQYVPSDFGTSETGLHLYALRHDPLLGRAAQQVLTLHTGKTLTSRSSYGWWTALDSADSRRSRLVVFRSLIRSLALKANGRKTKQSYLQLGDRLGPRVPDPVIYGDLATSYAALRRASRLADDLKRWEKLLELKKLRVYGKQLPLNPEDLATYHFKAAIALEEMHVVPLSKPVSVANHLQLATAQGERARDPALLFAIGAAQERNGMTNRARETRDAARLIVKNICREWKDNLLGGVCSEYRRTDREHQ